MDQRPAVTAVGEGETLRLAASGVWTVAEAERLDGELRRFAAPAAGTRRAAIDLSGIERLDTAGAWLLHRTAKELAAHGIDVVYTGIGPSREILFEEVEKADQPPPPPRREPPILKRLVSDTGEAVIEAGSDLVQITGLLGQAMTIMFGLLVRPWRLRLTSVTFHLEQMCLRAVPIVALICFLIGGIILQQGAYQLRYFGAEVLSIDLTGILVLREIGVLLTAIMIAGRSGSAITAEIGSMKMREEVDALRTLALDPVEVLIVPRLIALILALPLLTFVADIAALTGAGIVAWIYIDMPPASFLPYLKNAVAVNTFMVGLIKAPFMAIVIGMIACLEGLQVKGSAESLGRQTTSSVVKSIFMVIVLDGLFAMFFAAIDY
ncbi:phospholipid/cholesterol/gamma-HCH transport system permease protein [Tepidamorphus gemmatus]|uniref:Phospholipid/cholesterol/gamma-HCH transport system permease protein n=1 Tax=Tepidamorphus gemmatus TaxID=747076 RepID=A0A4R3M7W0_9HYPH|nr:MlaE family lipid ABC transporter permease subunit [Tepidamorphus gemmatus]TCT08379.1 phospholipid/cholesterol/gamma-HCH transport system permease protein [Tepidamorphus gemmatus]